MKIIYDEFGGWLTHPCPDAAMNNDLGPEHIDFHFDVRRTKTWLLSEYSDFGNYYVIRFCPWCGERLPVESEIDPELLAKATFKVTQ